jgi:hypothetical protein
MDGYYVLSVQRAQASLGLRVCSRIRSAFLWPPEKSTAPSVDALRLQQEDLDPIRTERGMTCGLSIVQRSQYPAVFMEHRICRDMRLFSSGTVSRHHHVAEPTLLTTMCKLRVATSYSFASYDVKYTPAETKVTWTAGLYSLPKSESTFFSSSF